MLCPQCGTENNLEQSYCRQCGLTLSTIRVALEGRLDEAVVKIKNARNMLRNGAGITVMSILILILGHLIGAIGGNLLILTPFDLIMVGMISLIGVPLVIKGALGIERANDLLSGKGKPGRSTLGQGERSSTALPPAGTANSPGAGLRSPESVTEHTTILLEDPKLRSNKMVDDEILTRTYEVAPESLWKAVKQALTTGIGAILKEVDEEKRRATFTTSISWTSWGENMVATVEPGQPTGARLKVTGHPHTSILTTKWGEEVHQHEFTKSLVQAVEQALS